MNKRYMDFVPKNKKVPVKRPVAVRKPVAVAEEPEVYTETYVQETVSFVPEKDFVENVDSVAGSAEFAADGPAGAATDWSAGAGSRKSDTEEDINLEEFFSVDNRASRRRKEPDFGVIEDYKPKFVKTEVTKRPLGGNSEARAAGAGVKSAGAGGPVVKPAGVAGAGARAAGNAARSSMAKPNNDAAAFKAQKIGARPFAKRPATASKTVSNETVYAKAVAKTAAVSEKETLNVPKTKFVNTEKVEKRPLSKNVYKKKVVAPKEEPTGPVTIITKPDKGSHIGVIVTIVLTIILGAAAGTVAFLLLPK